MPAASWAASCSRRNDRVSWLRRITSYNVCYTKLLRQFKQFCQSALVAIAEKDVVGIGTDGFDRPVGNDDKGAVDEAEDQVDVRVV